MAGPPGEVGEHAAGDVLVTTGVEAATHPGGVVLATVRTRARRDVVLQGGEVTLTGALAYRYLEGFFGATYGATARRAWDAATQPLAGPTLLRGGEEVDAQVLLPVPPDALPSVACDLVSVGWAVRTRVRYEGTGYADAQQVPVVVLADGRGSDVASGPMADGGARRDDLTLVGPSSRRLGPGDVVTGELVVEPRRSGTVREVRAELALVQHVPHGPWLVDEPSRNPEAYPHTAEKVVARDVLGQGVPVQAGGPTLRLPFTLRAPAPMPAPTLVTGEFSVRWVLRGVVERPRRAQRAAVTLELDGRTRD